MVSPVQLRACPAPDTVPGMRYLGLGLLILAACGGSGDGDSRSGIDCSSDERVGTYLVHYERINGDCPTPEDSLVSFNAPPSDAECSIDSERWSERGCKLERQVTCVDPSIGGHVVLTVVTTQTTDDGSVLEGIATVNSTGECKGSFRITATRQ